MSVINDNMRVISTSTTGYNMLLLFATQSNFADRALMMIDANEEDAIALDKKPANVTPT